MIEYGGKNKLHNTNKWFVEKGKILVVDSYFAYLFIYVANWPIHSSRHKLIYRSSENIRLHYQYKR